jgi:hypothetical protein
MKKIIKIKRFEHETYTANRGIIFIDNVFFGYSIERPNLDNIPFKSRIPAGVYDAEIVNTKKHGKSWLLKNVPNRFGIILFHPGSYMQDFAGCIGCGGELFESTQTGRMIINTRKKCNEFMKITKDDDFLKVIIT